jgi:hypothetical protein
VQGEVDGRSALLVGGITLGAEVQQEVDHRGCVLHRRKVQRRQRHLLVGAHARAEDRRLLGVETTQESFVAEGHGNEHVRASAAGEQGSKHDEVFGVDRSLHGRLVSVVAHLRVGSAFEQMEREVRPSMANGNAEVKLVIRVW